MKVGTASIPEGCSSCELMGEYCKDKLHKSNDTSSVLIDTSNKFQPECHYHVENESSQMSILQISDE